MSAARKDMIPTQSSTYMVKGIICTVLRCFLAVVTKKVFVLLYTPVGL